MNQPGQLQELVRRLKFRIKEEEGLYYLCSENKGADQLLCFRLCRLFVFSQTGSYLVDQTISNYQNKYTYLMTDRSHTFDPGPLQSVGKGLYKPRSRLHTTLAVGRALNPT